MPDSPLDNASVKKIRGRLFHEEAKRAVSDGLELPSVFRGAAAVPPYVLAKMTFNNMTNVIFEYNEGLNRALQTLDEQTIRDFYIKWNGSDLHPNKEIFWVAIHKTITGRKSLDWAFRRASKLWLQQRNLHSLDDGELSFEKNPLDGEDVPF